MTGTTRLMTFAASAMAVAMLHPAVAQDRATAVRQEIRHELLQLPYYSVFDFLAFKYDRGTAVLMGYGYSPALKRDAERAVKRVPGVDFSPDGTRAVAAGYDDGFARIWDLRREDEKKGRVMKE